MSSAPGTFDGTDFSLSLSLSLLTPHHPAPRSAAVNESGLIFLYLLHTAYNPEDENQPGKQKIRQPFITFAVYLFDCLPKFMKLHN